MYSDVILRAAIFLPQSLIKSKPENPSAGTIVVDLSFNKLSHYRLIGDKLVKITTLTRGTSNSTLLRIHAISFRQQKIFVFIFPYSAHAR